MNPLTISAELERELRAWRRDFHAYPELGFREYRTAAKVCDVLATLPGCRLRVGREVMIPDARAGVPADADLAAAQQEALALGANPHWVEKMAGGLTGVVAEWDFGRPGPTLVFRVDLDALPVTESAHRDHFPAQNGFASRHADRMHACGHDGHTTIGLGFARLVAQNPHRWRGKLRIIFQPAEEGCCGAASLVAAGLVADADRFVAVHVGVAATETGTVACGCTSWLATTKLDVVFRGLAAHAGLRPHEGRNALLAAATLALQLHALPRHGDGESRVNVGVLHAGAGRNIVPDRAELKLEVRGATTAINDFLTAEAHRLIAATAVLYDVQAETRIAGAAASSECDPELRAVVRAAAATLPQTRRIIDTLPTPGSEDATFFMNAVRARAGQATYVLVGAQLAAGHHHPRFDFDEAALAHGVALLAAVTDQILSP